MADVIPKQYLDLFDKKAFGNLGTTMQDGSPQVTPVWVDYRRHACALQLGARARQGQECAP